ncbi:cell division protein FtsZ [Candidatus Dependentiae bacterium]|nr:MAG: cell division protein FtsZ [Candidatus Dependentiae bacterium]
MIELQEELKEENNLTPPALLKVIGVGGAGGNTVNSIIESSCEHIETIAVNTDAQALHFSKAHNKIQIGIKSTKGLGTGANPELGKRAAEEDLDKVMEFVDDTDIVFLTAGMGGGTGSGALPTIARALREKNILSIAIVSLPFSFEGKRRHIIAEETIASLKKEVDTLIIIPNQKLLDVVDKHVSMLDAFAMINDVLVQSVKGITDIITKPGHINVDFADVRTIMKGKGLAVMGNAKASGENRTQEATLRAITSPLLENMSIKGAHSVLLNITGGKDLSLHEISEAATIIYEEAAEDAHIILGSVIDENIEDEVSITIIATGFDDEQQRQEINKPLLQKVSTHQEGTIRAAHVEEQEVYQTCKEDKSDNTEEHDETTMAVSAVNELQHKTKAEQQDLKESINTKPAMAFDDEDLDVPTFLRKGSSKEEMF